MIFWCFKIDIRFAVSINNDRKSDGEKAGLRAAEVFQQTINHGWR